MDYKQLFLKLSTESCRLLVGAVFVFSGFVKAIDPTGFAIKIGDYLTAFGLEKLDFLSSIAGFNLIAVEFTLGICLLMGVYRRYTSFLTLLMMIFMTLLTLYLALFNPVSDCGCFGDAVVLTNWETFGKNVVLLAATIWLFIHYQRQTSFFTFRLYWFVAIFSYLFCVGFAYYNYIHLPVIDFRPYKVGANIPELMSIPEGMEEDEYSYSFIYEKEGTQQEFALDNLPTDSSWTFVESKTELIKEGYQPPVEAFNIYDLRGDDVTDAILYDDRGLFLLIAPSLDKANDDHVDEINHVYDYAQEHQLEFYGVTGSSLEDINHWNDFTGAEYPFLQADDVLLKTILRANPGLVLLKEGTILGKWNYRDIPKEESLHQVTQALLSSETTPAKDDRWQRHILVTFIVPLLLVWLYDLFRNRLKRRPKAHKREEELTAID